MNLHLAIQTLLFAKIIIFNSSKIHLRQLTEKHSLCHVPREQALIRKVSKYYSSFRSSFMLLHPDKLYSNNSRKRITDTLNLIFGRKERIINDLQRVKAMLLPNLQPRPVLIHQCSIRIMNHLVLVNITDKPFRSTVHTRMYLLSQVRSILKKV